MLFGKKSENLTPVATKNLFWNWFAYKTSSMEEYEVKVLVGHKNTTCNNIYEN